MLATIFTTILLYSACTLFVQAHKKRSTIPSVRSSLRAQALLKIVGWILVAGGLYLLAQSIGWERGIPVWLALFIGSALLNLLVHALWRERHLVTSGVFAVFLVMISGLTFAGGIS
ncbi:MAG: hypothetical protein AAFY83_03975 [Pseudomonadota bacterium]